MKRETTTRLIPILVITSILLVGFIFRFINLNWDQNQHLHPDERFLTMVGNAMVVPDSLSEYLDPHLSTFNPKNVGFEFFVYGVLPLTLNKLLAQPLGTDSYNWFALQGRILSTLADLLVVWLVFKAAQLITRRYKLLPSLPYWSAFLYTIAVLPIQLSHFFAVDTFLTLFMFGSFYFALRLALKGTWYDGLASAIFMGLAMATKLNALYILPLNLLVLILVPLIDTKVQVKDFCKRKHSNKGKLLMVTVLVSLAYLLVSYLTLRLANPYIFESTNWTNPLPSQVFINNVKQLKSWERPDVWFPPAIQWINKPPVIFSTIQLAVFGIGIPYFIAILMGILISLKWWWQHKRSWLPLLVISWVGGVFLYQSVQFVKALRYFVFLYPFLSILAAIGIGSVIEYAESRWSASKIWLNLVVGLLLLIWPMMFLSVYVREHSRIQASKWIYENIPDNSVVLYEHWDDPLPLHLAGMPRKQLVLQELPVFGEDTEVKWQQMNDQFSAADYYILSSNRGWGSITTAPERYPLMSQFYKDLLADKNQAFEKVAEFTSYPTLSYLGLSLTLPDDWADETFTVYDHPKVLVFKIEQ